MNVAGTDTLYPTDSLPVVRALAGDCVEVDDQEIARPEGRVRLRIHGTPIRDDGGRIIAAAAAFIDITEAARANEELPALNAELEYRVGERTAELLSITRGLQNEVEKRRAALEQIEGRHWLGYVPAVPRPVPRGSGRRHDRAP